MRLWKVLILGLVCGLVSCSSEQVCAPGSTQQCLCTDGAHGAQPCASSGDRWESCTCTKGAPVQGSPQTLAPDPPGVPVATANQPAAAQPGIAPPAKTAAATPTTTQTASGGTEAPAAQEPAGSPLGARCLVDRECSSGECKGFKCVPGVGAKAPLGASCVVDGDCASLECKGFKCVPRK